MGIGIQNLEPCPRVNNRAITLSLNTENFERQQGVHINFCRVGGGGNYHVTLCLDLFVAVIADLVREGLPRFQSRKEINRRRPFVSCAKGHYEQSDQSANGGWIPCASGRTKNAAQQWIRHGERHLVFVSAPLTSLRPFKRRSKKSLVAWYPASQLRCSRKSCTSSGNTSCSIITPWARKRATRSTVWAK